MEDNFLERQKPSRQWQKFHALAKKFLAQDIKTLAGEGKGANMGETDREKAIVSQGGRGEQTRNE